MAKKTKHELEIENAELRGKVAALESILAALRAAPQPTPWMPPQATCVHDFPMNQIGPNACRKCGMLAVPGEPFAAWDFSTISVEASGRVPHDGSRCPSGCPGPHSIQFVGTTGGVPLIHESLASLNIGGPPGTHIPTIPCVGSH